MELNLGHVNPIHSYVFPISFYICTWQYRWTRPSQLQTEWQTPKKVEFFLCTQVPGHIYTRNRIRMEFPSFALYLNWCIMHIVLKTKTIIHFLSLPIHPTPVDCSIALDLKLCFLKIANKLFANSFEAILSMIKLMVKRLMPWIWSCRRCEQKIVKQFWGQYAATYMFWDIPRFLEPNWSTGSNHFCIQIFFVLNNWRVILEPPWLDSLIGCNLLDWT